MNNREAIEELKPLTKFRVENDIGTFPMVHTSAQVDALNMAIKALEDRPTGKWIFDGVCFSTTKFKCSICHLPELEKTNYCPNCGAKMKGGRE